MRKHLKTTFRVWDDRLDMIQLFEPSYCYGDKLIYTLLLLGISNITISYFNQVDKKIMP